MRLNKLGILPTGDELVAGVIRDTNSPALRDIALRLFTKCDVMITAPIADCADTIQAAMQAAVDSDCDCALLTGGAGGGKRFDPGLAVDCTHQALKSWMETFEAVSLVGQNGHLWARLVAGIRNKTLFFNVPGPYEEAIAAGQAGLEYLARCQKPDLLQLVNHVAKAVYEQYPGKRTPR